MSIKKKLKTKKRKLKIKRTKVIYGGAKEPKAPRARTPQPAPNPKKFAAWGPGGSVKAKVNPNKGTVKASANLYGLGKGNVQLGPSGVSGSLKVPGFGNVKGSIDQDGLNFKGKVSDPDAQKLLKSVLTKTPQPVSTGAAAALIKDKLAGTAGVNGQEKMGFLKRKAMGLVKFGADLAKYSEQLHAKGVANGTISGQGQKIPSGSVSAMFAAAKLKSGATPVDLQKTHPEIHEKLKVLGVALPPYVEKMFIDAPTQQAKTEIMTQFLSTKPITETEKAEILAKVASTNPAPLGIPGMVSIKPEPSPSSGARGAIAGILGSIPKIPSASPLAALSMASKLG